jgi:DNA-binding MarR family transcriptional regulator
MGTPTMSTRRTTSTAAASDAGPSGPRQPSLGLLPSILGYHLRRAQVRAYKAFAETVGGAAVTPGLFAILQVIAANPGISQAGLADALELDRSIVVNVLHRFEADGLVVRMRSPVDARSHSLQMTAAGTARLRQIEKLVVRYDEELTRIFSRRERDQLTGLLMRLYGATPAAPAPRRRRDRSGPRER